MTNMTLLAEFRIQPGVLINNPDVYDDIADHISSDPLIAIPASRVRILGVTFKKDSLIVDGEPMIVVTFYVKREMESDG